MKKRDNEYMQELFNEYGVEKNITLGDYTFFLDLEKINSDDEHIVVYSKNNKEFVKTFLNISIYIRDNVKEMINEKSFRFYDEEVLRNAHSVMFSMGLDDLVFEDFFKFYDAHKEVNVLQATLKTKKEKIIKKKASKI